MPTAAITFALERKGIHEAFNEACAEIRRLREKEDLLWASRFFELRHLENGDKKLWPVTQDIVSSAFDLSDLYDGPEQQFFYCDELGNLHPVTVGEQTRQNLTEESSIYYASADLIADGKVVGTALYTDH